MDKNIEDAAQYSRNLFMTMFCPFTTQPCIGGKCWCFRERKGPWAEFKKEKGEDGIEREVRTGQIVLGHEVRCELNVFDPMTIEVKEAPGFSLDENGNVLGPDGKPVKDDFDMEEEQKKADANRLKNIL